MNLTAISPARTRDARRKNQRGASTVEAAFVLPTYLLLCFGFVTFAWIMFGYCNATYAARITARYAAVHGSSSPSPCTNSSLSTLANSYLWGAPANGVTVASSWPNGKNIYDWVTVNITLVYPTGIPFASLSSITVGTSATEMITE